MCLHYSHLITPIVILITVYDALCIRVITNIKDILVAYILTETKFMAGFWIDESGHDTKIGYLSKLSRNGQRVPRFVMLTCLFMIYIL
jgi:hypothetical protein